MRRRRVAALCTGCGTRPPRARRGAKFCSPCVGRMPKKTCTACLEDFQPDMMTGRRCKPCVSKALHAKRVASVYGLGPGQYEELLAFQGGLCYICERRPVSKRLAVDHNHGSGEVRGLLCRNCNRDVLGHLRDDIYALERAIEYLTLPPARLLWGDAVPKQPTETK